MKNWTSLVIFMCLVSAVGCGGGRDPKAATKSPDTTSTEKTGDTTGQNSGTDSADPNKSGPNAPAPTTPSNPTAPTGGTQTPATPTDGGKTPPSAGQNQGSGQTPTVQVQGGNAPADGLAAGETLLDWKIPDIRVQMEDTLQATALGGVNTISDNALKTMETAKNTIFDRAFGMYCQVASPPELKKGEVMSYIRATKKAWPEDQHAYVATISFANGDSKRSLKFECIVVGEQKAEDFIKNLTTIVQFKDASGVFPPITEVRDAAYYKNEENKFRSFRIKDLEAFKKADVNTVGEKNSMSFVGGKLIPAEESQNLILTDKAQEACQISKVTGKIRKDIVYKWTDTRNLGADQNRGYGMLDYTYVGSNTDVLNLVCIMRLNAPFNIMLETLGSLVEFGAAK